MFYQDFQVAFGVLPIDLLHTSHESHIQIAMGDGSQAPPTPHANLVVMIAPDDGPRPPDPK